jgi:hypothetical protein
MYSPSQTSLAKEPSARLSLAFLRLYQRHVKKREKLLHTELFLDKENNPRAEDKLEAQTMEPL